jgi:hypothetical protein
MKTQKYCKSCCCRSLAERPDTNHILHFLITMFTCGLWVVVWFILAMQGGRFRCSKCGTNV